MTRWARANNAHKKSVEEATTWDDMWKGDSTTMREQKTEAGTSETHRSDGTEVESESRTAKCQKCGSTEHSIIRCKLKRPFDDQNGGSSTTSRRQKVSKHTGAVCYNCRKSGHKYSECSEVDEDDKCGVCYNCGSTEHISKHCKRKTPEGMPFARCFVCKEMGHISSKCPKNPKGIYIHGGHCTLCSGNDHLARDCPESKKRREEKEFLLTKQENQKASVELEDLGFEDKKPTKISMKTVKFN